MVNEVLFHKLSKIRVKVIRFNPPIATCELIDSEKEWCKRNEVYQFPHAICHIDNLERVAEKKQLLIFE